MEFVENTSASTASTCDMTDNATYPTIEANADHDAVAGGDGDDGEDHGSESNLQNFLGHLTMEEYRNIVHEYLTASSHISSTSSVEEFYRMNQQRYLNMAILSSSKHGFLPKASNGLIDVETLQSHSNIVQSHAHKSDFSVIQLIRFLFLDHVDTRPHRDGVGRILQNFSFWTGKAKDDSRRRAMEHTIFWSENHIFMYLSSAYLFHQYLSTGTSTSNQPNTNTCPTLASSCVNHHDCNQLLIYLESHTHPKFQGVYEVLSCTYLPWTICALLNLYDYARDENVRHHAKLILDNIVTTFCLVATKDGICNLTASARQYQDLRTKTWNHNITLLIILITGVIYDPMDVKPSPLGDFLATSSYQPPHDIISNYFNYHGSVMRKKMNHLVKETKEIYQAGKGLREVKDRELTPFYWSAGLITHPKYIEDTFEYIERYNLSKNPGISSLTYLPRKLAKGVMNSFDTFSKGQAYASIFLNLFKSPSQSIVMTSFEQYNVGRHAYQQNSWMVNMNGVGIWSQSGTALKEEQLNMRNPSVTQKGNVLVAAYNIDRRRLSFVDLFWPRQYFTSEYRQNKSGGPFYPAPSGQPSSKSRGDDTVGVGTKKDTWWIACRENMYLGVYCTESSEEDWSHRQDTEVQFFRNDCLVNTPTRKCSNSTVCWVVVVGDTIMYPHLADFQTYCTQLIIRDRVDQKNRYIIRVKTAGNDHGDDEATGGDLDDGCEAWTSYHGDSMCREPVDIKLIVPAP